jgi:hypothetical protein
MSFADLELPQQGVRPEPLLQAICDFPDKQPALVGRVRRDLACGLKQPDHGRRGLTPPQVLRVLDLMRLKNSDYRELRERIADETRAVIEVFCANAENGYPRKRPKWPRKALRAQTPPKPVTAWLWRATDRFSRSH